MGNQKKLSIIIVSYQVKDLLQACLASIARFRGDLDLEVIVVDNNSKDGTAEMLQMARTGYELRKMLSLENLGFARGNNLGLAKATGEYILFLNPDTEIIVGSLEYLVGFLDSHPDIAAVGPRLLNPDGSLQLSVRKFPTLLSQLVVLSKTHNLLYFLPTVRRYFQLDFDYNKTQPVEQVMGAALIIRDSVMSHLINIANVANARSQKNSLSVAEDKSVNFFDQGFERNFDEVDLCYRLKQAGLKLYYFSDSSIIHHKGASFHGSKFSPSLKRQSYFNHDLIYYFQKHKPAWQALALRLFLPLNYIATLATQAAARLWPATLRLKKREL